MSTATIGDIDVSYTEAGPQDADAVVLIHGLAEDGSSWAGTQQALADLHTFAYDLRGHGRSSVGEGDGTLTQLGNDLIAFLEKMTGPAVVVGFSLGGTIALWAAAQRPDLVTGAWSWAPHRSSDGRRQVSTRDGSSWRATPRRRSSAMRSGTTPRPRWSTEIASARSPRTA